MNTNQPVRKLNILFIETFYGGSHKNFSDALIDQSIHHFELVTLPDRCWKWRIRTSVWEIISLIEEKGSIHSYDLIFLSEMFDIALFKTLMQQKITSPSELTQKSEIPPIVCYFHENYLTYPNPEQRIDYQLGFSPVFNALCSDYNLFNSHFHKDEFIESTTQWLERIPEFPPNIDSIKSEISSKSDVIYPGIENNFYFEIKTKPKNDIPIILWNHRWDFDKKPDSFFSLLKELKLEGAQFKLILAGECSQLVPKPFLEAKEYFKEEIIHYGYAETRKQYRELCQMADITISTSNQENFGISFIEAVLSGCRPLLPLRLSYPELIPEAFKDEILYENRKVLKKKLVKLLKGQGNYSIIELAKELSIHLWKFRIAEYDQFFIQMIKGEQ